MSQTLTQIRKQVSEMRFYDWQNPLVEVEVYFNRFVIHHQNDMRQRQTLTHHASPVFSNTRMIVTDFEKALLNLDDIFKKIPNKWYLGKRTILVNVKEYLADGLTPIESRVLSALFAKYALKVFVFYQDELFFTQVLDERELKNAKRK